MYLYYPILYHTILYCTTLYYTVLKRSRADASRDRPTRGSRVPTVTHGISGYITYIYIYIVWKKHIT